MKIIKWGVALLVIALAIAVVAAPLGPVPGILIRGTATDVPNAWRDTNSIQQIQLQLGEGPIGRTVTILSLQLDGNLYVTGQRDAGWTNGIEAGGPVRMQLAGNLYELIATPLVDGKIQVVEAWQAEYLKKNPELAVKFPPPAETASTIAVFKLTKRL